MKTQQKEFSRTMFNFHTRHYPRYKEDGLIKSSPNQNERKKILTEARLKLGLESNLWKTT